ncbi:peptidase [Erythrobacter sp. SCSIO 43205]|uniref:M14 family zinc carboxypeptidase n=1 Tax=Erythrobacter sp. SCSIO 43205 TaxID=2779361 RepID=UPI001CA9B32C|nr:M14 family zinc carboxypeptidase [Erythrobacter sp. SCSIO 43205]UAB76937.1 peptidase [Erythrobacter sp. SCSIO 43205]
MLARLLAALSVLLCSTAALAEPVGYFQVEGVQYDESVPAYEDHAGYEIGERPVRMAEMVSYLRRLAANSDRIVVETIGYSHERRPILSLIVTSPENHANLENIRQTHLARLEGRAAPDAAPMVLWLNFGVHGAETSGMEAAVPVVYHFAAAQGAAVENQLSNAVLILTVPFNPDGHTRRIDHVDTFWSYADNSDPNDAAHDLWVEARTNHYWFDLNRQWLLLTQPESRAWVKQWHKWKPMLSVDYHEMGSHSPFYFHPGEEKRKNPLIPDRARDLTYGIAERHAAYLDGAKHLYTSEERFDNYYIGKGSTYPQINGALGILFEIGAARGGAVQTERGLVKTAENVRTQFRTALTSIQGALDLRQEITAYQRDFFAENARSATSGGWVFTADGDPERAARFVRLLNMHDIEVRTLASNVTAGDRNFAAGTSYFVPMAQTNNRMIRGIFDRVTTFEESIFYDVSGWTLPLAYDLDYAKINRTPASAGRAQGAFQSASAPDVAPYGYVFDWSHTYAPRALGRILSKGIMARSAMEGATVRTTGGEVKLGRGSIFVPFDRQEVSADEIHSVMETIAAEDGVPVFAATSGLTPEAGRDLGAANIFRIVEAPKVVLAYGDGLAYYDAGEMWWTLDYAHRMPVTLVRKADLGRLNWSEYTHLILVGGNSKLPEELTKALQSWIKQGGTLVATRDAALWAEKAVLGREAEKKDAEGEEARQERLDFADMDVRDAQDVIGGAIFATDLDTSHPLGFGYSDRDLPVHRNVEFTLQRPKKNPYAVPVEYTSDPLLSGYASERRQQEIAGTPSVVAERMGQGTVVLMADNPVFRGTFAGTEKLLMNALYFSGLIDAPRGDYSEE